MKKVVELVLFRLRGEAKVEIFMEASEKFEREFLANQKALISRHLISDKDGWGDLVVWNSMEAAQAAEAAMQESECAGAYNGFIDPNSIEMKHFTIEN